MLASNYDDNTITLGLMFVHCIGSTCTELKVKFSIRISSVNEKLHFLYSVIGKLKKC